MDFSIKINACISVNGKIHCSVFGTHLSACHTSISTSAKPHNKKAKVPSSHFQHDAAPYCPSWAPCCPSCFLLNIQKKACPFDLLSRPIYPHPGDHNWINLCETPWSCSYPNFVRSHVTPLTQCTNDGVYTVVITGDASGFALWS